MGVSNTYKKILITSSKQLEDIWNSTGAKKMFAIDTETDGVFSMTMQGFLFIFGWKHKDELEPPVVVQFHKDMSIIKTMYKLCKTVNVGFMHNAKFDLHVLANTGTGYPEQNIYDTMSVARLILEARPIDAGGPSLALKKLANTYIEKGSDSEQKQIMKLKNSIKTLRRKELEASILEAGFDPKEFSKVKLEKLESDPIVSVKEWAPPEVTKIWKLWTKKYPKTKGMKNTERVTYKNIYDFSNEAAKLMRDYAFNDVIYTLEIADYFMPYIIKTKQLEALDRERAVMFALYTSERTGIKIDVEYVTESKERLKTAILESRKNLQVMLKWVGVMSLEDVATFCSSPLQIKKFLIAQGYPENIKTNKQALTEIMEELKNKEMYDDDESEMILDILTEVLEHRKLLKKYSTDLLGYERNVWNGRRYTSFNQNGTVTGRLSNDMQQMANEGIKDLDGNELFHPRQAVIPSTDEGFTHIAYLDYSQVEVRMQAHYTWIAMNGKGDLNLLRMYVPFQCYYLENDNKIQWDPADNNQTKQTFIESKNWLTLEGGIGWVKTDMHMLTARTAFPELNGLSDEDPLAQKRRKQAKNLNFAIQYGAGKNKVIQMSGYPVEGKLLYEANKKTFIGLVKYLDMLRVFYTKHHYVENIYGRKYYLERFTHKAANYVVQGSGADLLKQKLVKCWEFLKNKKSRIIHNIHDEIQFEIHKDELGVIHKLKSIMEETGNTFIVPIITDIETTTTNWREKKEGVV